MFDSNRTINKTINRSVIATFTTSVISSYSSAYFANEATKLNDIFNTEFSRLTDKRIALQTDVDSNPGLNQSYRSRGVNLAWEYEKLDVSMGGSGTRNYTPEQQKELLLTGKIRGMEGQHINSAAAHPELQGNPDNIKFLTRDEHFEEHKGKWTNQTEGELIDKDKMVIKSNKKQILRSDLQGLAIAAAIGFGAGFTISAIMELAKNGICSIKVGSLLKNSLKKGIESSVISATSYIGGRMVVIPLLERIGVNFSTNFGSAIKISSLGVLSIAVGSVYQYARLRNTGVEKGEALDIIGKQTIESTMSLAASAVAVGIWGGAAGLFVSLGITAVCIGANIGNAVHERKFNETLMEYTVTQYKPIYIS